MDLRSFRHCPSLEDLDVQMCTVGGLGFQAISRLPHLTRFNVFGTKPKPSNLVQIMKKCHKLRFLNLGHVLNAEAHPDSVINAVADWYVVLSFLSTHLSPHHAWM